MPADISWDSVRGVWVVRGADEVERMAIGDVLTVANIVASTQATVKDLNVGTLATLQSLKVGAGDTFTKMGRFTGTTPAIGIGSLGGMAVATMTGASGAVAVADKIIVMPKAFLTLGVISAHVPTTNVLNVIFGNLVGAEATQPAVGWDVFYSR